MKSKKTNKLNKTIKPSKTNRSSLIKMSSKPIKSVRTVSSIKRKTAKIVKPTTRVSSKTISSMTVEQMISLITKAIQFKFTSDKTSPGLNIAQLRNGEVYVSVVRFNAPFGKEKKVEYKARNTTLIQALHDIARQIVNQETVENPIDQLSRYLNNVDVSSDASFDELVEEYSNRF